MAAARKRNPVHGDVAALKVELQSVTTKLATAEEINKRLSAVVNELNASLIRRNREIETLARSLTHAGDLEKFNARCEARGGLMTRVLEENTQLRSQVGILQEMVVSKTEEIEKLQHGGKQAGLHHQVGLLTAQYLAKVQQLRDQLSEQSPTQSAEPEQSASPPAFKVYVRRKPKPVWPAEDAEKTLLDEASGNVTSGSAKASSSPVLRGRGTPQELYLQGTIPKPPPPAYSVSTASPLRRSHARTDRLFAKLRMAKQEAQRLSEQRAALVLALISQMKAQKSRKAEKSHQRVGRKLERKMARRARELEKQLESQQEEGRTALNRVDREAPCTPETRDAEDIVDGKVQRMLKRIEDRRCTVVAMIKQARAVPLLRQSPTHKLPVTALQGADATSNPQLAGDTGHRAAPRSPPSSKQRFIGSGHGGVASDRAGLHISRARSPTAPAGQSSGSKATARPQMTSLAANSTPTIRPEDLDSVIDELLSSGAGSPGGGGERCLSVMSSKTLDGERVVEGLIGDENDAKSVGAEEAADGAGAALDEGPMVAEEGVDKEQGGDYGAGSERENEVADAVGIRAGLFRAAATRDTPPDTVGETLIAPTPLPVHPTPSPALAMTEKSESIELDASVSGAGEIDSASPTSEPTVRTPRLRPDTFEDRLPVPDHTSDGVGSRDGDVEELEVMPGVIDIEEGTDEEEYDTGEGAWSYSHSEGPRNEDVMSNAWENHMDDV